MAPGLPVGAASGAGLAFTLLNTGVGRRGASKAAALTAGVVAWSCGVTAAAGGVAAGTEPTDAPAVSGAATACAGVTICGLPPGRVMVTMLVVLFTITVLWMLL